MGRTNKRLEAALHAAGEMIKTTKKPSLKVQLIKIVIDYELSEKKRNDLRKEQRLKRVQNKKTTLATPNVEQMHGQWPPGDGKGNEMSEMASKLKETVSELAECKKNNAYIKEATEKASDRVAEMEKGLKIAQRVIKQLAISNSLEQRISCALELFQQFKSEDPQLITAIFEAMGFDFKKWNSWDDEYHDTNSMLDVVLLDSKQLDPEKRGLLRSKLAALGKDCSDALQAARDYRDLKIDLDQLNGRGGPHISIVNHETYGLRIVNEIPEKYRPLLTEEALRVAAQKMDNDPTQKLEWLKIAKELFNPDLGIGSLVLKELLATERRVDEPNGYSK
jgi:hypothetical protein